MADQHPHTPLSFETEQGAWRSRVVAGILVIATVLWMGSGYIFPSDGTADTPPVAQNTRLISVAVLPSTAQTVTQYFVAEGQAQPDVSTALRAESTGRIAEVFVAKGDMVAEGEIIARFDTTRNEADLARATQDVARAQREFDNAEKLVTRGVATNDRLVQARATLASANAALINAQEGLNNAEITAPIEGRIEDLSLSTGEFVSAGSQVGMIVDNTPLSVSIQVPQQSLRKIKAGQTANVAFITGETREGVVSFVGTSADVSTRTFLAEITVPNDDGAVPAGVSAEIRIPTGEATAHFMSPAVLSLGATGALGVKTVDDENTVIFTQVTIERAQTDGIWVSGLDDEVDIITVGQGYVNEGQTVDPQSETELAEATQ